MARSLVGEGRTVEVASMLEPLLRPLAEAEDTESQVLLRVLLARIRLLRFGDPAGAKELLCAWQVSSERAKLASHVQAEVALWLGWARAWTLGNAYDPAHALALFEEAHRVFTKELNPDGICWSLLGKAHAYRLLEEIELMEQKLHEAESVQHKLRDHLAAHWIHELRTLQFWLEGHLDAALGEAETLQVLARRDHIPMALGMAHAWKALILFDRGHVPEQVLAEAREAIHVLKQEAVEPGLLAMRARSAEVSQFLRLGEFESAWQSIVAATKESDRGTLANHWARLFEARLYASQHAFPKARKAIAHLLQESQGTLPRRMAAWLALLNSRVLLQEGDAHRASEWVHRALQEARESYHVSLHLQAQLQAVRCSLAKGALDQAKEHMLATEQHRHLYSILPSAALRFDVRADLAQAEKRTTEAAANITQALTAYELIGAKADVARLRQKLASLRQQRGNLADERASALDTAKDLRTAQEAPSHDVNQHGSDQASHLHLEAFDGLGATLAQAALSEDLVLAAWMHVVARLLPESWSGLYQVTRGDVHELAVQGDTSHVIQVPTSLETHQAVGNGIRWFVANGTGSVHYSFGVESSKITAQINAEFQRWLPVVALALDFASLQANTATLRNPQDGDEGTLPSVPLKDFVYSSRQMQRMVRQIHRIRASHSPVLITGESGTGKELIARAVHRTSDRKEQAFIPFNCSTVPHDLIDSHLFGHERGAFTGANRAHPGVIRAADGATLFLDEIGDLPLDVQPKLLRFLQEGEVFPLGARKPVRVNVRVIAATNQHLEAMVRAGRFREDLFYRLNVIPLSVPPLRKRRDEIPLLVKHFLHELRPQGAPVPTITNRAMEALLRYDWPGNIRQLRNEMERVMVFVGNEPNPLVDMQDLSPSVTVVQAEQEVENLDVLAEQILYGGFSLDEMLSETEKMLIERVLHETKGHVTAAADTLGLTRQGLYKKMKRLGIEVSRTSKRGTAPADSYLHLN